MTPQPRPSRGRLTSDEWALIRAAELTPWTPDLKSALGVALDRRGVDYSHFDDIGRRVELLEESA